MIVTGPASVSMFFDVAGKALRLGRAADVGAAVRDDREARDAVLLAVVPDEGRPPADVLRLVLLRVELRDHVLLLGEVVERPEVDVVVALADEGGRDHEAERRDRDERADRRADAERRELEEDAARIPLGLLGALLLLDRQLGDRLLGDDGLGLGSRPDVAGHLADPGEAEEEREDAAGDREPPVDDQPDEDEGDPAREGEGEDRRGREVLLGILVGRLSRPL